MSNRKQTRHARSIRPVTGKVNFYIQQIKKAVNVLSYFTNKSSAMEKEYIYVPVKRNDSPLYSSRIFSFLILAAFTMFASGCEMGADREYFSTLSVTLVIMGLIITFMLLYARNKVGRFKKPRPEAKKGEVQNTARPTIMDDKKDNL